MAKERAAVVWWTALGLSVLVGALSACTTTSVSAPLPAGSPSGHGHDKTIAPPSAMDTGEVMLTLGLPRPYQPIATNGAKDDYRCFLLDPGVTAESFITGVRFVPGNPDVVHHAIAYRVEPGQVNAARAKDAEDAQDGWSCFGGPQLPAARNGDLGLIDEAPWLAAWAPGGREIRYPAGTGVAVSPGEQVVLQVHYNLRAGDGLDQTSLEFRTSTATAGMRALDTMPLPAPVELPCRDSESGPLCDRDASVRDTIARFGGESMRTIWGLQLLCGGDLTDPKASATQSCDHKVKHDSTVYATAGHMHLLGKSITIDLNPGTPGERRVLDVPTYDFDQQGAEFLAEPLQVNRGDVLRVTCTHDTGLRDTLPALQEIEARYITWGEGTADEMCLGIVTLARD
jgi:hypothetical protein